MATLIEGTVLKGERKGPDQSVIGLVLHKPWKARGQLGADGCSFVTKRERDWV